MAGNRARDDGDILGLQAPKAKRSCKPHDDGDIIGTCQSGGREGDSAGGDDQDAMIEEKTPAKEGPFEGINVTRISEQQLEDFVHVMTLNIHLPSVGKIMSEAGCPRKGTTGVIPKMVSEACKIYMRDLIEMSNESGVDFVRGDAMFAKRYNL